MCLIVFAYNAHPRYKLIVAANRDEFYARPTAPADFWTDAPQVLAGKDLAAGGTWLGFTKNGRFAAVTNYRDPNAPNGEKSRGFLTRNFLIGADSTENYLQKIAAEKEKFSGFNLLAGDFADGASEMFYFSNRAEKIVRLEGGIYGLSNHLLDTNWQKVARSKAKLKEILQNTGEIFAEDLFLMLADRAIAADEDLPDTGIGRERERILSPVFIETSVYGTRCSTILTVDRDGRVNFREKTFVGENGNVAREFLIGK